MRSTGDTLHLDIQLVPLIGADGPGAGVALYFNDVTRRWELQQELELANRQIETAYEELQSTVEELETTNEELQSTNEELETMNEELQSTNDELQAINDELRERTSQLDDANAFLESILRNLNSAVVVVDPDLVVKTWNWRAEDLWELRLEEAVGQHLLNLDIGVSTADMRPVVKQALSDSEPVPLLLDGINRKGRPVTIQVSASALRYPNGNLIGAILLMDQVGDGQPAKR